MLHTFTPAHLRTLHPTMREYADQFVEVLTNERTTVEHDMLKYFKHVALDISEHFPCKSIDPSIPTPLTVGAASYGYATGVLKKKDTPLAVALETIVSQVSNDTIRVPLPTALRAYLPSLDWYLLADTRLFQRNVKAVRRLAYEVLYTRKQSLGVLTEADLKHIKVAGLDIEKEKVGNFALGIDDVLSIMLQVRIRYSFRLNPWRVVHCCEIDFLGFFQDAAMLDPDDPDKLDDEWILAQIMVLFWAGEHF